MREPATSDELHAAAVEVADASVAMYEADAKAKRTANYDSSVALFAAIRRHRAATAAWFAIRPQPKDGAQ